LGHFGNISLAVIVQEVQRLLSVLGITVVADGEIILKIHLEVAMMIPTFSEECIRDVLFIGIISHYPLIRDA
jgi:hypothetical protein